MALKEGGLLAVAASALSEGIRTRLRDAVRSVYSAATDRPDVKRPFPVGRNFAASLGYPPEVLASLPAVAVDAFAGVSNVAAFADIPQGARVLDLGCGAGLDSLITARRVGAQGKVIGIDLSDDMLARARKAAAEVGDVNITLCRADAESLPIQDGAMDVALVNGIFNLNPEREMIFRELARVMRVGGTVFAAELILSEPLPTATHFSEADWFA